MPDRAEFVIGASEWTQLPGDGRPEIAVLGRSNVGKSSLLNAVLGRKRLAYTSKTPGKTQELNYFLVDNDFYLVDFPGYGYAKAPASLRNEWSKRQDRYLNEHPALQGVIHLVDSRHPMAETDRALIKRLSSAGIPHILALTKTDKLSGNGRTNAQRRVDETLADLSVNPPTVLTSAQSNRGIGVLREWIRERVSP